MEHSSSGRPAPDFDLDLALAQRVQQVLFPKGSPMCSWCCIGVQNRMAKGVGGDYFDFITLADGCQMVFIGDVTGHGLEAALVMAMLYGYIHHSAQVDCDPLRVAKEINGFLLNFAHRSRKLDHFFSTTFFCSIIHPESLKMHYLNAGHPPPLVRRDHEVIQLHATGPPLGFFDQPNLGVHDFSFDRGDRLLLYTDGITESFNQQGEAFGMSRLETLLQNHRGDHLSFLDVLFDARSSFGASDPPADDCTAIALDFHRPFVK